MSLISLLQEKACSAKSLEVGKEYLRFLIDWYNPENPFMLKGFTENAKKALLIDIEKEVHIPELYIGSYIEKNGDEALYFSEIIRYFWKWYDRQYADSASPGLEIHNKERWRSDRIWESKGWEFIYLSSDEVQILVSELERENIPEQEIGISGVSDARYRGILDGNIKYSTEDALVIKDPEVILKFFNRIEEIVKFKNHS